MNQLVIGLVVGGAVVGPVVWACVRWQLDEAEDAERRARAIRDEAARIEAAAGLIEQRLAAQLAPVDEHQPVRPSVRVRVGAVWTDLREWAAGLGPDTSPDWAPGEVRALAERPPLRKRGQVHPSRRSWPMVELLPAPTPLEVAQRLAALYDPSRELRVIKVRTF